MFVEDQDSEFVRVGVVELVHKGSCSKVWTFNLDVFSLGSASN
jgi:hypothetical protein